MDEQRIIKKYNNRRLYDTHKSSYITLNDVKQLVIEEVPFKVVDAVTKEDLTNTVLLQIISANEEAGGSIFSTETMQNIIRSYGASLEGLTRSFLEKSMELFVTQNHLNNNPLNMMADLAKQNMNLWKDWMEQATNKS